MKIAMTVWGERISPVLDCARTLLVAEIVREEVVARRYELFDARCLGQIMQILARQGISVLICGAISQEPANIIEAGGIQLIPFLAGDAEIILQTFARGQAISAFAMPGCRCYGRCRMSQCGSSRKRMRT
ncbi:MAG: NifB/NifX family molybdenum-iron cluster-binding protein [Desulfoprunum sp.]|nr:NifB/NifX family molybdenum-iron cluster-binding protein [Desulfoprunum sp.]